MKWARWVGWPPSNFACYCCPEGALRLDGGEHRRARLGEEKAGSWAHHKAPRTGPGPRKRDRTEEQRPRLRAYLPPADSPISQIEPATSAHCHPLQLSAPGRFGSTQPTMARRPQSQPADPDPPPAPPRAQAQAQLQAFRRSAPGFVAGPPGTCSLPSQKGAARVT